MVDMKTIIKVPKRMKNKIAHNEYQKCWRAKNKIKATEIHKKALDKYIKNNPWYINYRSAMGRCNHKSKHNYKRYGGRGIKFLMTMEDFKFLWFRDKAYNMKKPSIDRINPDGNYELGNCRYLEMIDNIHYGFEYRRMSK